MRGHPLLQLAGVIVAFVLLGWPVWKLTHPMPVAAVATVSEPTADKPIALFARVSFVPAPAEFNLLSNGKTLFSGHGPAADFEIPLALSVPKDGTDFVIDAHWPAAGGHAAAHVTFQFPDGHAIERTLWADPAGALTEIVTVTP